MSGSPRGAVIRLLEADYRYGVGSLTIRIDHVDGVHPIRLDNEVWLPVQGMEIAWDGTMRQDRQVLVRADALRRSLLETDGC